MANKNGLNTNLAAEFFVASQIFRLGYTVTITFGNTKEVDLIVHNDQGEMITIDVKGLKNTTNWPVKNKPEKSNHFYVLVCYKNKLNDLNSFPDVFVIPAVKIKNYLSSWTGNEKVTCVGYSKIKDSKYKNSWDIIFKKKMSNKTK